MQGDLGVYEDSTRISLKQIIQEYHPSLFDLKFIRSAIPRPTGRQREIEAEFGPKASFWAPLPIFVLGHPQ